MLNYAVYLQLKQMLGRISSLTGLLKNCVDGYAHEAERYLTSLQEFVDGQRLPVSADIAVELQKLLSYDGKSQTWQSPRKARDIFAVGCVERVQVKINSYLEKYDKVFSECADACRQLAAQLASAGMEVPKGADAAGELLSVVRTTESLKPYYAQLVGMVGVFNLRAIFDLILPQVGIK